MAHVTEAQWKGMRDGTLGGDAYFEVLSHVGECDECALRLAGGMEENPLLKAPQGIGQAVKQKLLKPSEAAVKSYRTYRRRVLLAMCATLVLVFSGVFTQFSRLPVDKISQAHTSFSIKFKEGFSAFSQKLWIMEDHNNEKTKK